MINAGTAFRTSGCPGKEADDVSACDRPYGNSPPRDIASYPFKLNRSDIRKARRQIDAGMGWHVHDLLTTSRMTDEEERDARRRQTIPRHCHRPARRTRQHRLRSSVDRSPPGRKIPDTIRFLRFRPSALIGIHQYLSHELKLDYCKAHGIETVRRITGGGGLYFDEGQIGWELVFDRASLGVAGPC